MRRKKTHQCSDNLSIQASNRDTEKCTEYKKRCMQRDNTRLFGGPTRKKDAEDRTELLEERPIDVRSVVRWKGWIVYLVVLKVLGSIGSNADLKKFITNCPEYLHLANLSDRVPVRH